MIYEQGKTLIFIRHAQALSRDAWYSDDRLRPLSSFGEQSILQMGAYLRDMDIQPQKIITSPALRTKQTTKSITKCLGFTGVIEEKEELWAIESKKEAAKVFTKIIHAESDRIKRLVFVGHNPSISQACRYFSQIDTPILTPGSISILHTDKKEKWSDFGKECCNFIYYQSPQFFKF